MTTLSFNCWICGKTRTQQHIGTVSYPVTNNGHANLRYCNDNETCVAAAKEKADTRSI
jgi:hypothetical protein